MQAGEVIWLLAGIGVGLTVAMLILAGVLVVDGQRLKRRLTLASSSHEALPVAPVPKIAAASRPVAEPRPRPVAPPPVPVAPPVTPRAKEPIVAEPQMVEPATAVVEEMMSDLAAEIARVQSPEPVTVQIQPAPEPVRVVAEAAELPAPASLPPVEPPPEVVVVAPEVPASPPAPEPPAKAAPEAPPLVVAPKLPPVPAPPKVPPLPKVTPARKFAPALPPRNPPAPKS